ncbi:MAG: uridine phosphorylase [Halanaerobiales bacterium]|nr:uridine phosphorylase [Halanaerobiales bacterium]
MTDSLFLPILKVDAEKINPKVLVCGDPERAARIAERLDDAEEISYNREYRLFNGKRKGREITVASHGVGASGAAVCFEELIKGGAKEIIRIGTAGSLSSDIQDGEIVIATGAIREDGLTDKLVSLSYPAIASHRLVSKLEKAGTDLGIATSTGIVLTLAAFYPELDGIPNNYFSRAGAIAVEMEASALFIIASLHGIEAGAVLAIDGMAIDFDADSYNPHRDKVREAIDREIELAIEALIN